MDQIRWQSKHCQNPIQKELFEIRGFDVVLLRVSDIDPGDASWKTGVLAKHWIPSNSQQYVWLEEHLKEIFDERTAAPNDLHRNRGFSLWQLLLGKTPTDKSVCENPDLAQCSVEVVDEAAKQRKEIHQARPWKHWAAGEWCWYWRSGKHKGSRMKGAVFTGPARASLQERETTAEGVRMKGVVWITEGASLVRCAVQHLRSLSESEKRLCSIADTEAIRFQDLVGRLPHSIFLDLTTQTDAPDDAWEEEITGWTHEANEIRTVVNLAGLNDLMQHHVWDLAWCHQVDL